VATVRPLGWATGMVRDNFFVGGPGYFSLGYLRATGPLPGAFVGWSDFEISLWFRTNWYNSLRWSWDVPLGWHAEWYWDPLGGFGAEFGMGTCFWWPCPYWGPGYGNYWCRGGDHDRPHLPHHWCPPIPTGSAAQRPVLRGRISTNFTRPVVVRLADHSRVTDRLRTDPGLRSIRQARHLDVRPVDIRRARLRHATRSAHFPMWSGYGTRRFSTVSQAATSSSPSRRVGGMARPSPGGGRAVRPGAR
jgi:hypothetical protein